MGGHRPRAGARTAGTVAPQALPAGGDLTRGRAAPQALPAGGDLTRVVGRGLVTLVLVAVAALTPVAEAAPAPDAAPAPAAAPAPETAPRPDDPLQQLEEARQGRSEAEARAAELDAAVLAAQARLAASASRLAELDDRLEGLQSELAAAQESLEAAQTRRATADEQLAQARRALGRAEADLRRHQEVLARSAAGAYKHGSSSIQAVGMLESLVHARDPAGFTRILEYMEHAVTAETKLIERAAELRQQAAESRDRLAAAQMQRAAEESAAAAARDRSLALAAEQQVIVDAAAAERGNRQQLLTALQVDQNVNIALVEDLSRRADTLTVKLREQRLRALRQMLPEAMSSFLCPIAGPVQFINDWGFPRSGGRTHQGTDLFADYGTPIVAIADGVVTTMHVVDEGLGGLTVTYSVDGHRFYNAHLSAIADGIRDGARLRSGDVIGYVGVTGNARGTPPHDHFGWYPPGSGAVNPYPLLRAACR